MRLVLRLLTLIPSGQRAQAARSRRRLRFRSSDPPSRRTAPPLHPGRL